MAGRQNFLVLSYSLLSSFFSALAFLDPLKIDQVLQISRLPLHPLPLRRGLERPPAPDLTSCACLPAVLSMQDLRVLWTKSVVR